MERNNSGKGQLMYAPEGLKKWNWGAFFFTWIWGLGNGTYMPLLSLLPILNIVMPFYLGAKGHKIAWESKYWPDVESCNRSQRNWAIAGFIIHGIFILILIFQFHSEKTHHDKLMRLQDHVISAIEASEHHEIIDDQTHINMNESTVGHASPIITIFFLNSNKDSYIASIHVGKNRYDTIRLSNLENDDEYILRVNGVFE